MSDGEYEFMLNEEFKNLQDIIRLMDLHNLLEIEEIALEPYGSIVNGFALRGSDLDVAIHTFCYLDERAFLSLIYNFMKNYSAVNNVRYDKIELILKAKTPLISIERSC